MEESDHRQELIPIIAVILSSELNKLTSPYCLQALDNLGGFLFSQYKLWGVELCLAARLERYKKGHTHCNVKSSDLTHIYL